MSRGLCAVTSGCHTGWQSLGLGGRGWVCSCTPHTLNRDECSRPVWTSLVPLLALDCQDGFELPCGPRGSHILSPDVLHSPEMLTIQWPNPRVWCSGASSPHLSPSLLGRSVRASLLPSGSPVSPSIFCSTIQQLRGAITLQQM